MVKKINSNEFAQAEAADVAVIDFSANWCGPCKMLAPVLEEVSEEIGNVSFFNVDVDDNPDLALKYSIMSIPALVVLKKGVQVNMNVGFVPKDAIVSFIKSNM